MTSLGLNIKNGALNVISWEGLTFKQVVSSIQKNTNDSTQTKLFFYPAPLKIYRRNIGKTGNTLISSNNERQSVNIANVMEQPGSTINTSIPICSNNGVEITTNPNIPNSTYEKGVCDTNTQCMNLQINSLNRVRSSGMIRKKNYNVNSYQYLQNRDRTFSQNQFNYINTGNSNAKPGSPLAINNTYLQNANGQFNVSNNAVIFKPNNSKYGQQGGVSSSSRIERIKHDTVQDIAYKYKQTFGTTSNDYKISATYGGSNGPLNGITYGKKDLYNVPTPQLINVDFSK
jgi:hypothetical protein